MKITLIALAMIALGCTTTPAADSSLAASNAAVIRAPNAGEQRLSLRIDGLHCGACAKRTTMALEQVTGVTACVVSFDDKRAEVLHTAELTDANALITAVTEAGYQASLITEQ
ncbi:MAG: heavy-metal-associated domain-containing protein [Planctomycetota bacterium]|jgi:copper chaperone CopZ